MEKLDVKLDDPGEVDVDIKNKKSQRKFIIIMSLLILIILVFVTLFIIELLKAQKLNDDKEVLKKEKENLQKEIDNFQKEKETIKYNIKADVGSDMLLYNFGKRFIKLSYAEDDVIINSFVKDGNNYIEEVGEMNNGQNYTTNERNVYDLYIPSSVTEKKDKYNRIILFIHGGAWIMGEKGQIESFCSIYGSLGFITATMGYTILMNEYEQANAFRIMDEITATIKSIKKN